MHSYSCFPVAVFFAVRPRYRLGRPLPRRVLKGAEPVVGALNLMVQHYSPSRLVYVLELRDASQGVQLALLPSLYDPQFITFGSLGFLVRGTEHVEPNPERVRTAVSSDPGTQYVQEWHVQFVKKRSVSSHGGVFAQEHG